MNLPDGYPRNEDLPRPLSLKHTFLINWREEQRLHEKIAEQETAIAHLITEVVTHRHDHGHADALIAGVRQRLANNSSALNEALLGQLKRAGDEVLPENDGTNNHTASVGEMALMRVALLCREKLNAQKPVHIR